MPGDLYGFSVIAAALAALVVGVIPGYRIHSGDTEELLSALLYVCIAPLAGGFAAMLASDLLLMLSCFVVALGFGVAWLVASLSYFVLFA
jgi:hypothetical protein